MVCTSIGLTVQGVPVVGVIYNPFLDQLVSTDYASPSPLRLPISYFPSRIFLLLRAIPSAPSPSDSLLTGHIDLV
jgi:hypothetical protein